MYTEEKNKKSLVHFFPCTLSFQFQYQFSIILGPQTGTPARRLLCLETKITIPLNRRWSAFWIIFIQKGFFQYLCPLVQCKILDFENRWQLSSLNWALSKLAELSRNPSLNMLKDRRIPKRQNFILCVLPLKNKLPKKKQFFYSACSRKRNEGISKYLKD